MCHKLLPLALLIASGACVAPAQDSSEQTVMTNEAERRTMEGDALQTLLFDAYVTAVRPPDVLASHPPGEVFRSNGVYERILGRTRIHGTYEFQGNAVCVQGRGLVGRCRTVTPQPDGTYILVDVSDGSSERMTIKPLRMPPALTTNRNVMPAGLTRLSGDTIRTLIVGRTLFHDVDRAGKQGLLAITSLHQEMFRADGGVGILFDRGGTAGRYEIIDNELCLHLINGVSECRHLFRASNGDLLQKDAASPFGEFTPIIIK